MNERWYNIVEANAPITQRDIIFDCPLIRWKSFEILLYMEKALKHLSAFLHETLPLLPNVDFSLLPDMKFDNVRG